MPLNLSSHIPIHCVNFISFHFAKAKGFAAYEMYIYQEHPHSYAVVVSLCVSQRAGAEMGKERKKERKKERASVPLGFALLIHTLGFRLRAAKGEIELN